MLKLEIELNYPAITTALVMGFFSIFIVAMMVVFIRRVLIHRNNLSKLKTKQSRALLQTTIQTQEVERERIGSDIHDDIGPMLSLLKLQLNKIEINANDDSTVHSVLEAKNTLNDVLGLIRSVSNELSPAILNELGLAEAMKHMEQKLISLSDAKISFNIKGDIDSISKAQSIAIYRIVQESLTNILRHANAQHIRVDFTLENKLINLNISDDGDGFDFNSIKHGLGLKNIKARVESFAGDISINSESGKGTNIHIKMEEDGKDNILSNS